MTRLRAEDIAGLAEQLAQYDIELRAKTGLTLKQIACLAAGLEENAFEQAANSYRSSVVPISSGQGVITGFSQLVGSISTHLGFDTLVTNESDVAGIAAGLELGRDLSLMADDKRFIAINHRNSKVVDNAVATARGFVAGLDAAAKGLADEEVLVIGLGPVGLAAVTYLKELGARPVVYDVDPSKLEPFQEEQLVRTVVDIDSTLPKHKYIVEATPAASFLDALRPDVTVAAPGVPLGLTDKAYGQLQQRVLHDPLQLGVATMLAMAVS